MAVQSALYDEISTMLVGHDTFNSAHPGSVAHRQHRLIWQRLGNID